MRHKCVLTYDGDEPVCSHALTVEMLNAMGFTIKEIGQWGDIINPDGMSFNDAKYAAWVAGKSRLCYKPPAPVQPRPAIDLEAVAFFTRQPKEGA